MTTYEGWESGIEAEGKPGPLWENYGYRRALFAQDLRKSPEFYRRGRRERRKSIVSQRPRRPLR